MVQPGRFFELVEFCGVAFFSLGVPLLTFSLQESMKDQRKFLPTLDVTMAIIALVYVAIGVIGYGLFVLAPGGVYSIIISHLPSSSWSSDAIKLVLAATLLFSAPLSLVPSLNMLNRVLFVKEVSEDEESAPLMKSINSTHSTAGNSIITNGNGKEHPYGSTSHPHHDSDINDNESVVMKSKSSSDSSNSNGIGGITSLTILRLLAVGIVTGVAIWVPCFNLVLSMIGSVTITLLCFILPPYFYLVLHAHHAIDNVSWLSRLAAMAFILAGIIVMASSFAIVASARCE